MAKPDVTDKAFKVGLYAKGIDGLLELAGGLLLLFIKPHELNSLAHFLTQHELSTDPNDFIANHVLKTAHALTTSTLLFGAIYLLSHGIVKIVLVIEVLRQHTWAYIALIIVTSVFVVYQVYRLSYKPTFGLTALTIFDIAIIYLTQKEYRRIKAKPAES